MCCAKPRRDGMKSVRACVFFCELDLETLGRTFPLALLAQRVAAEK